MIDKNTEGVSLQDVPNYTEERWVSPMNYLPEAMPGEIEGRVPKFHDVTLRDGEQTPSVVFTEEERIAIALALDKVGIDRIEFGMPIVGKDIYRAFERILEMDLNAEIAIFSRAHPDDLKLAKQLKGKSIIIEHNINPYTCKYIYKISHDEAVRRCVESMKSAKDAGMKTVFMGWDASRANLDYLKRFYTELTDKVVPDGIIFVDTYGVMSPFAMLHTVRQIRSWLPEIPLEVHGHNELGCGTANYLAAFYGGASMLHTSINGLGERTGNAGFQEVVMALECLAGVKTNVRKELFMWITNYVADISKVPIPPSKPIVGDNYFKMEAGISVHALQRFNEVGFEGPFMGFAPQVVGREGYDYLLGKKSGMATIDVFLNKHGLGATDDEKQLLLETVKNESTLRKNAISEEDFLRLYSTIRNGK